MNYPSNAELAELLVLQAQIKIMEKRVDAIKKACKKAGSFFTDKFTVSVITRTRVGLAGLEEVKDFISEDILNKHGLIRKTDYQLVEVGQLPEVSIEVGEFRQPVSK